MKKYLLTPGPTPVPNEALQAMARPIIHHRTPQFVAILKDVNEGLKYVFQTQNDVITFTSSGTGAMQASITNFLSKGDKAIVVDGGKFGERWTEICKTYGVNAIVIKVQYGNAVDPKDIEKALKENKDAKAVYATLCETSTGVTIDLKAIGEIVAKTDAMLVVDAISALGACELKTDEWKVDIVVSGSQKGLMIPPGLAFMSVSKKAYALAEKATLPDYYFGLKAAKKALASDDTPWTPAISLIIALRETLSIIKTHGIEKSWAKYTRLANATRAAAKAMGLELFSTAPSDAVTAVKAPAGIDGEKLVKTMRDEYGVGIAGGQSEMKGKVFRIAHMGDIEEFDIIVGISCLEIVLTKMGYKFNLGSGVKAAQEVFLK